MYFNPFCWMFYRLCLKVLNDDRKLWEDEVYKFARKHQLEVGYDFLQRILKIEEKSPAGLQGFHARLAKFRASQEKASRKETVLQFSSCVIYLFAFIFQLTITVSFGFCFLSPSGHCTVHSNKYSQAEPSTLWNGLVRLPQERCQGD